MKAKIIIVLAAVAMLFTACGKDNEPQLENNTLIILETEGELKTKLATADGNSVFYGRTDRIDQLDGHVNQLQRFGHLLPRLEHVAWEPS